MRKGETLCRAYVRHVSGPATMHVCLICREYPIEAAGGGIGTYTRNLAYGLARAGHRVSVVASESSTGPAVLNDHGVRVCRPALSLIRTYTGKTVLDAYVRARAVEQVVARIQRDSGIDVVQAPEHGAESYVLASNRAIPHVVRFHTPLLMVNQAAGLPMSLGARLVHRMERRAARAATLNTSASRALAQAAARLFAIPLERVRIIPNFIDHELFRPAQRNGSREPTVLFVGKVAPLKGATTLAAAIPRVAAAVPDVRFILVGSNHPSTSGPSMAAEMKVHLEAAGVAGRVSFLPLMRREQLVPLYQQADLYVLPTLWDNFPNTCLEAMACGVPVVASAVGGVPEIVRHGEDGVLVPPSQPAALAEAIIALLRDGQRRRAMGASARQRIQTCFTAERIVEMTLDVYREAVDRWRATQL